MKQNKVLLTGLLILVVALTGLLPVMAQDNPLVIWADGERALERPQAREHDARGEVVLVVDEVAAEVPPHRRGLEELPAAEPAGLRLRVAPRERERGDVGAGLEAEVVELEPGRGELARERATPVGVAARPCDRGLGAEAL